jgi:hypothetical protein
LAICTRRYLLSNIYSAIITQRYLLGDNYSAIFIGFISYSYPFSPFSFPASLPLSISSVCLQDTYRSSYRTHYGALTWWQWVNSLVSLSLGMWFPFCVWLSNVRFRYHFPFHLACRFSFSLSHSLSLSLLSYMSYCLLHFPFPNHVSLSISFMFRFHFSHYTVFPFPLPLFAFSFWFAPSCPQVIRQVTFHIWFLLSIYHLFSHSSLSNWHRQAARLVVVGRVWRLLIITFWDWPQLIITFFGPARLSQPLLPPSF